VYCRVAVCVILPLIDGRMSVCGYSKFICQLIDIWVGSSLCLKIHFPFSWVSILRGGIAGLGGTCTSTLQEDCQTDFHTSCVILRCL